MNIQTEKLDLIEWISKLNDTTIIDKLRELEDDYSKSKDWWYTLKKEEIDSINRGLKDFEEGRTHSHDTARSVPEHIQHQSYPLLMPQRIYGIICL